MKKESIALSFFILSKVFRRLVSMRTLQFLTILLLFCALQSCEGVAVKHGHVYNKMTNKAIDSVQVIPIFGKNDTLWKCAPPPMTADSQAALDRDEFHLAFTDSTGYFFISSGLIGMGPGDLEQKVLFIKKGYIPVIIKGDKLSNFDSVKMEQRQ